MQIGLMGLGKMGYNLALNMKEHDHQVVVFNRSKDKVDQAVKDGLKGAYSFAELVEQLPSRKAIWLMLPAGNPVDDAIKQLIPLLKKDDIIIDGGNSNYKDTIRRAEYLQGLGLSFVDIGTSGGIEGARNGACAMIGAEAEVFQYLEPLLRDICVEKGYIHAGQYGAGHFVKMVHNGIEYGMMQAIGEGFEVLQSCRYDLDLREVARVFNHGSVIRSWLMELAEKALSQDPQLESIKGVMHSSGEGLWTLQEALELRVPVPVIADSVFMRYRSLQEDTFSGKVVAALRNQFGGHAVERR